MQNTSHKLEIQFTNKKKFIVIISWLILLIVVAFMALSTFAKNKYWSDVSQDIGLDMSRYSDYLNEHSSEDNALEDTIMQANLEAIPIPTELENYFQACNDLITTYFNDNYRIDVSEKFLNMQIMSATYPSEASVGGSFYADVPELSDKLFISSNIIDRAMADISVGEEANVDNNKFNLLRTIYIHETMHYLGFSSEPELDYFIEAMAESLHEKIIDYSGMKYDNATGYRSIKDIATQIIDADKKIVSNVLTEGVTFDISQYFDTVLGEGYAQILDDLTLMLQKNGEDIYKEIPYYAQFVVYEYVKAINEGSINLEDVTQNSIINNFELKWLFNRYK